MKSKTLLPILFLPTLLWATERNVSVEFRAIAPTLAPMIVTLEGGSNKEHFLEIPEGILSTVQKYHGGPDTIFRDVSGQRIFPVRFPESSKMLLVVLRVGPDGSPSSIVLENEASKGSLRFVNITSEPLRIEAAGELTDLESGANKTLVLTGKKTVFIKVSRPKTGEVLLSNNWAFDPSARTLAIFAPDSTLSSGVRVHRFSDTSK